VRREKLRKQHSVTGCITVFIRTNPFNPQEPQYQPSASLKLDAATQDSRAIIATANRLLKEIYKAGYGYHKCGVQLSHIQPELFDFADNSLPTEPPINESYRPNQPALSEGNFSRGNRF